MIRHLPENQNYKLAFDNLFSSTSLFSELSRREYLAVATIRKDRMGFKFGTEKMFLPKHPEALMSNMLMIKLITGLFIVRIV